MPWPSLNSLRSYYRNTHVKCEMVTPTLPPFPTHLDSAVVAAPAPLSLPQRDAHTLGGGWDSNPASEAALIEEQVGPLSWVNQCSSVTRLLPRLYFPRIPLFLVCFAAILRSHLLESTPGRRALHSRLLDPAALSSRQGT